MNKNKTYKVLLAATLLTIGTSVARAQLAENIATDNYKLDSAATGNLTLEIDNISFFKDNEYTGNIVTGYTLPGFWLQPKIAYQPLKNVKVEAGLHALVYDGANKYPNYAYQDIAKWKGSQYQKGAHLLPFFRAQLCLRSLNLVWGNLYGGSNHGLAAPMYNPELNLTADPEMGFQVIYDRPRWHFDAWIDWQSFIFKKDTHQESFIVGLSSKVIFNDPSAPIHVYMPIQGIIQHRGGELDTLKNNSVQTLMNGAAGIGLTWNTGRNVLRKVNVEADVLGYYQQAGSLWPFDKGAALYAKASADLWDGLRVEGGWLYAKKFISILGIPYFGTVSTTERGGKYDGMKTAFASIEYSYKARKYYAMGAKADCYLSNAGRFTHEDGTVAPPKSVTNFSIGVFFRLDMDMLLWKNKKAH